MPGTPPGSSTPDRRRVLAAARRRARRGPAVNPGAPIKVERQPTTYPAGQAGPTMVRQQETVPQGRPATGGGRPGPAPGANPPDGLQLNPYTGAGLRALDRGGVTDIHAARERLGHKFRISFTPDGRIVHTYGKAVSAGNRRVVLPKS